MKTKTIKQSVIFKASPAEVYGTLMDPHKHSQFTGAKAKISQRVGGKFSAYDGYAYGENLKLVPGKKIVQSWRASDWPKDHYSTVTYEFTKNKTGTKLSFTHTGVPENKYESIKQGWTDYYWQPMKDLLEK